MEEITPRANPTPLGDMFRGPMILDAPMDGPEAQAVTGRKRALVESQDPERTTEYTPAKRRDIDKNADAAVEFYNLCRKGGVDDIKGLLSQFTNPRAALLEAGRELAGPLEAHEDDFNIIANYVQNKDRLSPADVNPQIGQRLLGRILKRMLKGKE